jgi:hypothetical protein
MFRKMPRFFLIRLLLLFFGCFFAGPLAADSGDSEPAYDRLLRNPNYFQAKLSPDGRYLAFQTEYKSRRSIAVFDLREKESQGITVNPGRDVDDLYWISNDTIAFHVSKWGIYTEGLHGYDLDRGRSVELLATPKNRLIFKGMVDPVPQLEDRYAFKAFRAGFSGTTRHGGDLYLGYVRGGKPRLLAENTGDIVHWVVDLQGEPLYAIEHKEGNRVVLRWNKEDHSWEKAAALPGRISPIGTVNDHLLLCKLPGGGGNPRHPVARPCPGRADHPATVLFRPRPYQRPDSTQ